MGKAEAGSTKAIANAIKAKGLGRLRWYCQVCEKQCRDENGFQAHCKSEPHMRKILQVGPKAGQAISEYSNQFQSEFMLLLRTRHQTNRVRANAVYNEYIQDKHHVHMNATRWVTLSGFVQTIGKAGLVKVDEDEKGIWITWVDNRPETLQRQRKDRAQMDGEERERAMLELQIARAKAAQAEADKNAPEAGLQKTEGEKVKLSLAPIQLGVPSAGVGNGAPADSTTAESSSNGTGGADSASAPAAPKPASTSISFGSIGVPAGAAAKPLAAANPLKRPAPMNVFKAAKAPKTSSGNGNDDNESQAGGGGGKKAFMSEAERLMKEDQARKSMRPGGAGPGAGSYGGFGPRRADGPRKSNF